MKREILAKNLDSTWTDQILLITSLCTHSNLLQGSYMCWCCCGHRECQAPSQMIDVILMHLSEADSTFQQWRHLLFALQEGITLSFPYRKLAFALWVVMGYCLRRGWGDQWCKNSPFLFSWNLNSSKYVYDYYKVWSRLRWWILQIEWFLAVHSGIRGLLWSVQIWMRLTNCRS